MRGDIEVKMMVAVLRTMTPEQLKALQDNILADGNWETQDEPLIINGGDYISVDLKMNGRNAMFIGIEKDGYTHS